MFINNCETSVSTTEECAIACSKNSECKAYFSILKNMNPEDTSYRCCLYRQVGYPYKEMAYNLAGGTCGILESL
jgi:hypothetical protein